MRRDGVSQVRHCLERETCDGADAQRQRSGHAPVTTELISSGSSRVARSSLTSSRRQLMKHRMSKLRPLRGPLAAGLVLAVGGALSPLVIGAGAATAAKVPGS